MTTTRRARRHPCPSRTRTRWTRPQTGMAVTSRGLRRAWGCWRTAPPFVAPTTRPPPPRTGASARASRRRPRSMPSRCSGAAGSRPRASSSRRWTTWPTPTAMGIHRTISTSRTFRWAARSVPTTRRSPRRPRFVVCWAWVASWCCPRATAATRPTRWIRPRAPPPRSPWPTPTTTASGRARSPSTGRPPSRARRRPWRGSSRRPWPRCPSSREGWCR